MPTSQLTTLLRNSVQAVVKTFALFLLLAAAASFAFAGDPIDGAHGVPEIDAGSLASALTLLTGGVLLLTDRIRRR